MNKLGDNIKKRRKELDMTLEELAKYAGVSKQTISRYETGEIRNIPSDKIEYLAEALKTTPSALMGWDTNGYYLDEETKKKAQEIFSNPKLSILFDASRKVTPNDLDFVHSLLLKLQKEENNEEGNE